MTENDIYYQNLIYLYIDGEASDAEQKVLFDQMANNSVLQEEFSKAMEFNKAMVEDREYLAPSLELTKKVFDKAGFISNSEIVQYPHLGANIIRKLIYSSRSILQTVGSGLVAASILFTGYNIIEKFDKEQAITTSNKIEGKQAKHTVSTNNNLTNIQNSRIPIVSSVEIVSHTSKNQATIVRSSKNTYFKKNDNDANTNSQMQNTLSTVDSQLAVETNPSPDEMPLLVENSVKYETPYLIKLSQIPSINLGENREYPFANNWINNDNSQDLNLSFRINGISGLAYYPSRDIENSGEAINNFALNVSYHFDDHQSLGLNVGREALQLYDVKQEGKIFKFERQPNILWAGINYRYSFGELFELVPISPYSELTIGGTKYGPIGKLSVGMNYNISNSIQFGFGYEFTSLVYTEFSTYKITNKSGLIYNISYKL